MLFHNLLTHSSSVGHASGWWNNAGVFYYLRNVYYLKGNIMQELNYLYYYQKGFLIFIVEENTHRTGFFED